MYTATGKVRTAYTGQCPTESTDCEGYYLNCYSFNSCCYGFGGKSFRKQLQYTLWWVSVSCRNTIKSMKRAARGGWGSRHVIFNWQTSPDGLVTFASEKLTLAISVDLYHDTPWNAVLSTSDQVTYNTGHILD